MHAYGQVEESKKKSKRYKQSDCSHEKSKIVKHDLLLRPKQDLILKRWHFVPFAFNFSKLIHLPN